MPLHLPADQDAVARIVSRLRDIAVLPHVVFRIIESTGHDDASAVAIERIILVDPGFCAKVLSVANSAAYALPKKVTNIRDAIMFLGVKQVRNLAMTVGVFDLFVGKNDRESLRRRDWWRHSLDSAVCARWLALTTGVDPDEAYVGGLLHFLGKTVLDRHDPAAYEKVMVVVGKGVPDVVAERHLFGADHVEIGMAVAQKWGFPESLIGALDYVNPTDQTTPTDRLRATVAVAHGLAHLAVSGVTDPDARVAALPAWALILTGVPASQAASLVDGSVEAIAAARAA